MKKTKINGEHVCIMVGLLICLVALIFFLSPLTPIEFLSYGVVAAFGFIGYWLFIPFLFLLGIYIMFKGKLVRFRFDISLGGLFLIMINVMILASYWGSIGITLSDGSIINNQDVFIDYKNFMDALTNVLSDTTKQNITLNSMTGGGFVGFLLLGLFNSGFTTVGMMVVAWILIAVGIMLVFNRQIKKFFVFCHSRAKLRKEKNKNTDEKSSETPRPATRVDQMNATNDSGPKDNEKNLFAFLKRQPKLVNPNKDDDIGYDDDLIFSDTYSTMPNEEIARKAPYSNDEISAMRINQQNHFSGMHKAKFAFGDGFETCHEEVPLEESMTNKNFPLEENGNYASESTFESASFSSNSSSTNDSSYMEGPVNQESIYDAANNEIANQEEETVEDIIEQNEEVNQEIELISQDNDAPNRHNNEALSEIFANKAVANTLTSAKSAEEILPKEEKNEESDEKNDPLYVPPAKKRPKYNLPPLTLLDKHEAPDDVTRNNASCEERQATINQVFEDLNIGAKVVSYTIGPSVTRFNVQTFTNVSVTTLGKYVNDISIRLGGVPVRFEPIVYGMPHSGLEIPNEIRTNVGLRETLEILPLDKKHQIDIPFGKSISGDLIEASLGDFPHMLVAGTTGSGKSIFMHSVILSLIMRNRPEDLKIVLIDPKRVELSYYKNIPHLLCPSISDASEAKVALEKLVEEMERRYSLFEKYAVRDIKSFNAMCEIKNLEKLPYILVFVDEYADLVMNCKEIGVPVVRIGQKARAAGIHLVIATQRPEVKIITGDIKANLPTRVALMVGSAYDSQTIIGEGGAEKLLGNGDMLVDCSLISKTSKPRVQGCFVDINEIIRVCDYLRAEMGPLYDKRFLDLSDHSKETQMVPEESIHISKEMAEDDLYNKIKEVVYQRDYVSISFLTRTFGIGFPRAGRLFAKLQKEGIVSTIADSSRGSPVLKKAEKISENPGSIDQSIIVEGDDE